MKRKYIVPTVTIAAVDTLTRFLETISFQVGPDPHGGWSDAKGREDIHNESKLTDPWTQGLW